MRCEDARRRLMAGLETVDLAAAGDTEVDTHLAGCDACFEWLEASDPLAGAVRAARPEEVAPSPSLAVRVLDGWRGARTGPREAPIAVLGAALALAVGFGASAIVAVSLGGAALGPILRAVGAALMAFLSPLGQLGRVAVTLLAEHPAWLVGLAVVGALAAWGWARIDLRLGGPTRGFAR